MIDLSHYIFFFVKKIVSVPNLKKRANTKTCHFYLYFFLENVWFSLIHEAKWKNSIYHYLTMLLFTSIYHTYFMGWRSVASHIRHFKKTNGKLLKTHHVSPLFIYTWVVFQKLSSLWMWFPSSLYIWVCVCVCTPMQTHPCIKFCFLFGMTPYLSH